MKTVPLLRFFCVALALAAFFAVPSRAQDAPPTWAYHLTPEGTSALPATVDDGSPRKIAGSAVRLTLGQTRDRFQAPDWHPADHAPMPESVLHGRKPSTYACGFCHRAQGQGGPDSANISGLDKDYIVRQVQEMGARLRQSAADQRLPMVLKSHVVKSVTDQELQEAALYFSSLPARSHVRVVEADLVPKTLSYLNLFLVATPDGQSEALGQRIIEIPDDFERFELRDSYAGFTAYVPPGSISRGRALAQTGAGTGIACVQCHGEGLKGGTAPRLASQYATYLLRQLYDLKTGRRKGVQSGQMAPILDKLSLPDMIALAAYAASLVPASPTGAP